MLKSARLKKKKQIISAHTHEFLYFYEYVCMYTDKAHCKCSHTHTHINIDKQFLKALSSPIRLLSLCFYFCLSFYVCFSTLNLQNFAALPKLFTRIHRHTCVCVRVCVLVYIAYCIEQKVRQINKISVLFC